MIFSTVCGPHDPAFTVGSFAITATNRPPTSPTPVTTPSAGRSPARAWVSSPSSTNESASSKSSRSRSRTKSFPCSASFWWYFSAPPAIARRLASPIGSVESPCPCTVRSLAPAGILTGERLQSADRATEIRSGPPREGGDGAERVHPADGGGPVGRPPGPPDHVAAGPAQDRHVLDVPVRAGPHAVVGGRH